MSNRILLVEDTPDLMENIKESLAMEGYDVWAVSNGEKALAAMKDAQPKLIITDLLMPVMSGFEFIQRIRENKEWKNIPILVFSAMPPHENEKKIFELGANHYLKKPSTLTALLDIVHKIIQL